MLIQNRLNKDFVKFTLYTQYEYKPVLIKLLFLNYRVIQKNGKLNIAMKNQKSNHKFTYVIRWLKTCN